MASASGVDVVSLLDEGLVWDFQIGKELEKNVYSNKILT
jgi:hypothetical protein